MKGYLKSEVADMADFLISEKAKSISGQVFEMDYGIVTFKYNPKNSSKHMIKEMKNYEKRAI
jgi:enoyl-[acyl-carrier-protein] reductase (NADH)